MIKLSNVARVTAWVLAAAGLVACDSGGGVSETNTAGDSVLTIDTGPDRTPLVVNGTDVPDLRYPWMAAVYFRVGFGNSFSQGCGGSLISDRWVVSAAHCFVDSRTGRQRGADEVALLLGTPALVPSDGIVSRVSRVIVHPNYSPAANLNDIALLELPDAIPLEPIALSSTANPVPDDGEIATVAGWGATSENGGGSFQLQETDLPIVSTNNCRSLYGSIINGPAHLCAGGQRTDACFGDSGGPLMVARGNQLVQAGVVSFGFGCARPGLPAVYTRASTYFDWISDNVGSLQAFDGSDTQENTSLAGTVQIRKSNAADFALESATGGANGQNVYLWSANAADVNQQWVEINRGNGLYSYQKNGTNFCLDGNRGGAQGQNVYLWTCGSNNQNQMWEKESVGDGSFRLVKSNAAGFAIDGGNGGARNQNVQLSNSSSSSTNLNWIISPQ